MMRNISPSVVGSWGVAVGAWDASRLDDIEAVATNTIAAIQTNETRFIGVISEEN
jgi:hypothetical protein